MRPYEIEKYLEEKRIFKDRIVALFTNYRTDWRNPSTHDYILDFDEDEAFLAMVSVSAFTKLLIDQIAEKLSFDATVHDLEKVDSTVQPVLKSDNTIDRVVSLFENFAAQHGARSASVPIESEAQLMGALAGFLSSMAPDLHTSTGRIIRTSKPNYIDMIVEGPTEQVIVELKRGQSDNLVEQGKTQLISYLAAAKAKVGILFMYVNDTSDYVTEILDEPALELQIRIIRPRR